MLQSPLLRNFTTRIATVIVYRCGKLKKMLKSNKLITLPDIQHLLAELETPDMGDNPDLVMPPKPAMLNKDDEFYNIDFSLDYQRLMAGAPIVAEWSSQAHSDPIARKLRLRRPHHQVLKGMRDIPKKKAKHSVEEELKSAKSTKLNERPHLDFSGIFEEEVGQIPGLTCWEIDNFLPNQVEEALIGKFHKADCYIILMTYSDRTNGSIWSIYFWIGVLASLDKKACSAIHAISLRNVLGAECRTIREEMYEESNEFLNLFKNGVSYIDGERASSGFYIVEKRTYETKVYRAVGVQSVHMERCPVAVSSLDPRFVYLVDTGLIIYLWVGKKSKEVTKTKSRLIAEKISKNERQGKAEIEVLTQDNETAAFWKTFNVESATVQARLPDDYEWKEPKLYKVRLGMSYLELPKEEVPDGKLRQSILDTKQVYILDCKTDVFVWLGKKSARLIQTAALKLSQEIKSKIDRRDCCTITSCLEGTESQIFKTNFVGWDDVLPVDYTRTAESITRRGADMKEIMERDKMKTDLSALFFARQPSMEKDVAEELIKNWNADSIEAFVLQSKKFVRLPKNELGIFHSEDCYVFLCRYWLPGEEEEEEARVEQIKCVVYFWQGRDAGNMGYLTFTFSLQKKFEALIGDKLEVVRTHQQQENLKFMSLFKGKYVIRNGKRRLPNAEPMKQVCELFELRANGGIISTRCIQIRPHASFLNSCFCFILMVPSDDTKDLTGIVYVWCGSKADHDEASLCQDIARMMYQDNYSVQVINEGEEPENFWVGLGGKEPYEKNADFMEFARLFRCSNEKGYFAVFEKYADFCQDDLADDDVMILDNGHNVFLWVGKKTSEIAIKLSFKSAQVYIQHLENKQPERPRKLMLAMKYKEHKDFTKCFHGWGGYNEVKE